MKILIVDDEPGLVQILEDNLQAEKYETQKAYNGPDALNLLNYERFDLILLDIKMPKMDGFAVLEKIRVNDQNTPILFLTARSEETDKVKGLLLGADDYITKPFSVPELLARIKAHLRRVGRDILEQVIQTGQMKIDFPQLTLSIDNRIHSISRYEAEILALFLHHPGRVISRDEILDKIWGIDAFPSNRTIDNYIVKLRRKIEINPAQPQIIQSVYGKGYRFVQPN